MSGAPWQLEGFTNQPPNNQVQFYNPNQYASGAKAGNQDNNTATGAESGHYADWQQQNQNFQQNGYYGQQPGYYGQQDVNQQWNQDGNYVQTSQPGGAPVSGGEGGGMYAGYGHVQGGGAQGGLAAPAAWNNTDPLQFWDNSYDYQNPQHPQGFPPQQQQAYGEMSTMSSQPSAFDQASSFSQDTEADAEVQAYTSGLGTQAGAAQLPQPQAIQPEQMEDISLDEPAAAGHEAPPVHGVSLTSAASFPSLGDVPDPFSTISGGEQAPAPSWPHHPPPAQQQRSLTVQQDKSVHSRQSSAGGNVQFVLGGSEAGSTDNSHSNSPAPFAKVNAVQGIMEEPHQQQQIQPHLQHQQQQQQHQQQLGDSWNYGNPPPHSSANSSGFGGVAEMPPHQDPGSQQPPQPAGDNSQPPAADDGWGWGDEENDVDELLRQHDQQASTAETSAASADPSSSQVQPIEAQPHIPHDQVVPEVPGDGSSGRQEASLGAAVVGEEAWPEMVDSGLNAGEVPNQGQQNPYIGQGHPGDSPQVNPGPPVYQRSPSQTSVHSSQSQQSLPGSDLPPRKDRSYSSASTISTHSNPSVSQLSELSEAPPTSMQAPPPATKVPPPGDQAPPPHGGPPGPPTSGAGAQGDNPFRRTPGSSRFGPPTSDSGAGASQPPQSLPVNQQSPPRVQPPNAHLASPLEPHPDSPFQPPVKSANGESIPPLQTPPQAHHDTQHPGTPQQHRRTPQQHRGTPQQHRGTPQDHHAQQGSHRKRGSRDLTMSPATTLWENQDVTVGRNVHLFSPSFAQQEAAKSDTSQSSNVFFPAVPLTTSNTSAQGSVLEHSTGSSANDQNYAAPNHSPDKNPATDVSQVSQYFDSPQSGNYQQNAGVNSQQQSPQTGSADHQHQMAPTSVANPQHQMAPVSSGESHQPSAPEMTPHQFASQAGVPSSQAGSYFGNQGHAILQQNTNVSHDSSNHSAVIQQPTPQRQDSQGFGSQPQSQQNPMKQHQFSPQTQNPYEQQNVQGQNPQQSQGVQGQEVVTQGEGQHQGMPHSNQGQMHQCGSSNQPTQSQAGNFQNTGLQNSQLQNSQNWQSPVQSQPCPTQNNQGASQNQTGTSQNQMRTSKNQQMPPQSQEPPQNPYGPPQNQYGPPQNQYGPPQNQYGPPQNQFGPPQNQQGLPQDSSNNQYSQNLYSTSQSQPSPSHSVQSHNQGPYNQQSPQQFQQGPPNNQYTPQQGPTQPGQSSEYSPGQQPQTGNDDLNRSEDQGQRSQPPIRFPGQRAPPGQRGNQQQTSRQDSQETRESNESMMKHSHSMTDADRYARDPYYRGQYRDYYSSDPRYQGYDQYYRPTSRGSYRDDYYRDYYGRDPQYERPRSRQGYPDDYDRPRSVTDYERPRSRQGQPDDKPRSRPASRQGENTPQSGSRPSSRVGKEAERARSQNEYDKDYRDRRDPYYRSRSYQDFYDYYNRDYYSDYYDYYGYRRDERYSRGYYDEMKSYGQDPGEYEKSRYERSYSQEGHSDYDRGSSRSSRSTTPNLETAADQFAREFHQGSRPGSRSSGYEQSPIYPADTSRRDHYHDRSYDYGYDPRYDRDRHYDYYREHHKPREPARLTPVKFSIPHLRASFGPGGQLVQVLPNNPLDGQPARVTVQDYMHIMITTGLQEELKSFPGPLVKGETHKNDVLQFCQNKIQECKENTELIDQQSAELVWRYLCLLIKQNGTIVGTDVCDLLLEGHEPSSSDFAASGMSISVSSANLYDVSEGEVTSDKSMINKGAMSMDDITDRFRNLLLRGRKKDALEWAIKNNLWGHALFLASKMDAKTHASVMTRFANVSMKINDPLQTLYQLMSGRQPAAVTLMSDEKWGDWRPHLAMILGNPTQRPDVDRKSVINLGDTLAAKGLLFASHFCYLMAQVPFGQYHKKSSKFVLIGSSHGDEFDLFATNEAIQCTEVFEYAISLGNPLFILPTLQTYKLLYAYRLAENSMPEEALRYCEVLATAICQNPVLYQAQMVQQSYDLATRLKYYDPERLQASDDDHTDPVWITNLGRVIKGFQDGSIQTVSGTQTPMGYGGSTAGGSSEAGDSNYGQVADPTSQYVMQQQQYWQNYDPNQQYAYTQQWPQSQEGVPQGQEVAQGQAGQVGQVSQGQADQSQLSQGQGQDQSADAQAWQQHSQLNALTVQQQQQWAEWQQQQYAADGSYLGYVQQQQQQQQTPEDAQPADGTQPEDTQTRRRRTSTLSRDETDAAGQAVSLGSSMNSNYTATSSNTATSEETEESQPGTPTPDVKDSFDYYAASTKSAAPPPLNQPHKLPSPNAPSAPSSSTLSSPDSPNTLTPSTPTKTSTPRKGSYGDPALFKFGVPPPQSNSYSGAPSSVPLGASGNKQTLAQLAQHSQGVPPGGQKSAAVLSQQQVQQQNNQKNKGGGGGGWFGGIISKIIPKGKNEMKLPDDKDPSIVWDPVAKRWKNTDESEEEQQKSAAPPPKDMDLMGAPAATPAKAPVAAPAGAPPPSGNRFSRQKTWGARGQYVDVLAGNASKPSLAAPAHLFNVLPPASTASTTAPANIFVPSAGDPQPAQQNPAQDDENLSRSSSMSSLSQEVQHFMQGPTSDGGPPANQMSEAPPPVAEAPPTNNIAPPTNNAAAPPGLPMMFNPSQFSAPQATPSTAGRMKYGQRRAYPK